MSSQMTASPPLQNRSARLSRQSTRRAFVGAWVACCLGLLLLGVLEVTGPVWFVLLALALIVDIALFVATHRVTDRPTAALDERQQAVRDRAYRSAYLLVFYALSLVVAAAMLLFFTGNEPAAATLSHPASHPALLSGLGIVTLQLLSLLPTALVAWTEGDEPSDLD